jgi:hypothetical protein
MDLICSSFQLYKYYLHVMGFWPLLVETKSITHEPLNLQSFKIPGSLAQRKNNGNLLYFSVLVYFLFILLFPTTFSFPFSTSQDSLRQSQILFHHASQFWSPDQNMRSFQELFKCTTSVTWVSQMQVSHAEKEGGRRPREVTVIWATCGLSTKWQHLSLPLSQPCS